LSNLGNSIDTTTDNNKNNQIRRNISPDGNLRTNSKQDIKKEIVIEPMEISTTEVLTLENFSNSRTPRSTSSTNINSNTRRVTLNTT